MSATVTQLPRRASNAPVEDKYFETDQLRAELKERSVRGLAITLSTQVTKFGLGFASTTILARMLTPDDFGLIAMVTALTAFCAMFVDAGLSMATVQRARITQSQVSTLFWINVLLSALLALSIAALAPLIAWFYGRGELTWVTVALAGTVLFGGLTIQHQALLRRQMRFGALAAINLAAMLAGILTAIVMAWQGAGYWALVGMYAAMAATNAALVWLLCDWRPGRPQRRCGAWPMVTFGGNLMGFSLVSYLARNIDNVLIGWWWGASALGFYAKAYSLLLYPIWQVNAPLSSVVLPALSRLQDDPRSFRRVYLLVVERLALVVVPAVAFLIATARPIILLVLGPQWEPAADIFAWLGVCALVQPIANTCGWLLISQGRTGDMFKIAVVNSTLAILAIVAGLPWGAIGVAALYAVSDLTLRLPILFWYVSRTGPIRVRDYVTATAPAARVALGVWLAVSGLRAFCEGWSPAADVAASLAVGILTASTLCLALPRSRKIVGDLYTLMLQTI